MVAMTTEQLIGVATCAIGAAALLGGAVLYLIKVERTLVEIKTNLMNFCGESKQDRKHLWDSNAEIREGLHSVDHRVTAIETRVALMPSNQRGPKPA